eukprot:TRINITY_DN4666_c0_g1_i7.p2 TRINITY_DN4666_c0_g1~~TRINITY_DN4666_c0_g1_i7.p2  ORF type:complete len:115 (-),score=10.20 TRINITY_DN4666_c0_g1_i7:66-410(-)
MDAENGYDQGLVSKIWKQTQLSNWSSNLNKMQFGTPCDNYFLDKYVYAVGYVWKQIRKNQYFLDKYVYAVGYVWKQIRKNQYMAKIPNKVGFLVHHNRLSFKQDSETNLCWMNV